MKTIEKEFNECKGCRTYGLHIHGTEVEGCQILYHQYQCRKRCVCNRCILKSICLSPCLNFLEFLCDETIISVEEKNRSIKHFRLKKET